MRFLRVENYQLVVVEVVSIVVACRPQQQKLLPGGTAALQAVVPRRSYMFGGQQAALYLGNKALLPELWAVQTQAKLKFQSSGGRHCSRADLRLHGSVRSFGSAALLANVRQRLSAFKASPRQRANTSLGCTVHGVRHKFTAAHAVQTRTTALG